MVLPSSAHQSTDSRHDWWLRLPHLLGLTGATGHTSKFLSETDLSLEHLHDSLKGPVKQNL